MNKIFLFAIGGFLVYTILNKGQSGGSGSIVPIMDIAEFNFWFNGD